MESLPAPYCKNDNELKFVIQRKFPFWVSWVYLLKIFLFFEVMHGSVVVISFHSKLKLDLDLGHCGEALPSLSKWNSEYWFNWESLEIPFDEGSCSQKKVALMRGWWFLYLLNWPTGEDSNEIGEWEENFLKQSRAVGKISHFFLLAHHLL